MPTIDVDGATVSFLDTGSFMHEGRGEPVVLLHSSAGSGGPWRALAERLGDGFRVLAPDLYGYGKTEAWPGRRCLTLSDEAALVSKVAARAPGPIHLVGHSYGGAVALRFALEHPEQVRSLTLIEPVAFTLLRDGDGLARELLTEVTEVADAIRDAVLSGDYWGGMARFVDYWNGPGTWDKTRFETQVALSQRVGKVALDFSATIKEPTPLAAYRALRMPTLVLSGETSPGATHVIAECLAATLPRASLRMVQGAGHMSPLTHRDAVNDEITRHLTAHSETEAQDSDDLRLIA